MPGAEQAGRGGDDIALNLRGFGVFALLFERDRQVAGYDERLVVWAENALMFLERLSAKGIRFCIVSQIIQRLNEVAFCGKRIPVVRSRPCAPRGERRPQKHRRIRALAEVQKQVPRFEAELSGG